MPQDPRTLFPTVDPENKPKPNQALTLNCHHRQTLASLVTKVAEDYGAERLWSPAVIPVSAQPLLLLMHAKAPT